MKQKLIPRPDITITKSFNQRQAQSLKILEFNNDELLTYLKESSLNNHFLSFSNQEQDSDAFLAYDHSQKSLYDEIIEQAKYSKYHPDLQLCEFLIFQLDSNGYFRNPYEVIVKDSGYPKEIVKKHLAILRTFEPYGLFAFTLSESLKIQCKLSKDPRKEDAFILCDYLEDLAQKHLSKVQEHTHMDEEQIEDAFAFIQTLNPKPAANYSTTSTYVNPEFTIEVVDNKIKIQLLQDDLQIEVLEETLKEENQEIRLFLQKQRQEAKAIMDSIKKRNMTLLQIMQVICEVQSGFFLHKHPLQRCTLQMISDATKLHVSTISRAITNKSCEFEKQYYTLKSFFHSGGTLTHTKEAIQERIIQIIKEEDKYQPYSDEKIRKILEKETIKISRRAVTKYREAAFLYNSQKRRQEK